MTKLVVLMGKPCSGKSTVGKIMAGMYSMGYISTGDIARAATKNGLMDSDWQEKGQLAPEETMRRLFEQELVLQSRYYDTVVIDGFPRTEDQVDFLEDLNNRTSYYLIRIDNATTLRRMESRDRDGENWSVGYNRLKNYRSNQRKISMKLKHMNKEITKMDAMKYSALQIATIIKKHLEEN